MPLPATVETSVRFNANLLKEVQILMLTEEDFPFNSDMLFVNIGAYLLKELWDSSKDKDEFIKKIKKIVEEMKAKHLLKARTTTWKKEKEKEKRGR